MTRVFYKSGCVIGILLLACAAAAFGQAAVEKKPERSSVHLNGAASSPAYAEILLKKTEFQSEVESLVLEYTEEFPKVKELRFMLILMDRDIARLARVKPTDSSKLTLALGKLIVRKIELETDVWNLRRTYKDEHPDVKRAKRRVEIYENAINEILN